MNIQIIILFFLILLLFIDYYHKQYRIKYSKKDFKYRNSHSFYDDTDYTKYRPYKEVYTYKIAAIILFIVLIFDTFLNKNFFTIIFIKDYLIKPLLFETRKDALSYLIFTIILYFLVKNKYKQKNKNFKLGLENILVFLIFFILLIFISKIVYS